MPIVRAWLPILPVQCYLRFICLFLICTLYVSLLPSAASMCTSPDCVQKRFDIQIALDVVGCSDWVEAVEIRKKVGHCLQPELGFFYIITILFHIIKKKQDTSLPFPNNLFRQLSRRLQNKIHRLLRSTQHRRMTTNHLSNLHFRPRIPRHLHKHPLILNRKRLIIHRHQIPNR